MSITSAIAIYFIIWWTTLFAVLPIGVRTQAEEGEVSPGTPESAPHRPRLLPKMLATTVVASIQPVDETRSELTPVSSVMRELSTTARMRRPIAV